MTTVLSEEIAQFRSQLEDYPEVLQALNVIEECDGNLEDAAEILAIQAGAEIVRGEEGKNLLEKYAQKLRPVICTKEFENAFINGSFAVVVTLLAISPPTIPLILLTPVLLYVSQKGWSNFCKDCDPVS